jgi:DNA replication protein DnaC
MRLKFKSTQDKEHYVNYLREFALGRFKKLELGPPVFPNKYSPEFPPARDNLEQATSKGLKLWAYGSSGTGKTTLLKWIAWKLCLNRRKPSGGSVLGIVDGIKSNDPGGYIEWLNTGDFLVLDDFDKLRGTYYEAERLLRCIDQYDVFEKPIFISSNIDPESTLVKLLKNGITLDYVDSLKSRLFHRLSVIEIRGKDWREENQNQPTITTEDIP